MKFSHLQQTGNTFTNNLKQHNNKASMINPSQQSSMTKGNDRCILIYFYVGK